jgi:hypothetical protein
MWAIHLVRSNGDSTILADPIADTRVLGSTRYYMVLPSTTIVILPSTTWNYLIKFVGEKSMSTRQKALPGTTRYYPSTGTKLIPCNQLTTNRTAILPNHHYYHFHSSSETNTCLGCLPPTPPSHRSMRMRYANSPIYATVGGIALIIANRALDSYVGIGLHVNWAALLFIATFTSDWLCLSYGIVVPRL